ncbi:hypothetical protein ACFL2V_08350 [Pseudomonadota bacterium]
MLKPFLCHSTVSTIAKPSDVNFCYNLAMSSINQTCRISGKQFIISDEDQAFYTKMDVPLPTLCPEERRRLRYLFRNERHWYHRNCDLSNKPILSIYHPDSPFKVYDNDTWWSDEWTPLDYGRDYDFTRPFFEQYKELSDTVPRLAIQNAKSENCKYTNYSSENKNCYLVVGTLGSEDCYYSYRIFYSKDIIDCYDLYKCELCYESIQCKQLYHGKYCKNCESSYNLTLCENCTGCQNCFGCVNLRNKKYHIFNEAYSEAEYHKKVAELEQDLEGTMAKFKEFRLKQPHKALQIKNCENCHGDQLFNSRNCHDSYILKDSQDCAFMCYGVNNKDCMDANHADNCELQYNAANLEKNNNIIVANLAWYVSDSAYITLCFNSNHLFGCVGMKKNKHCILNKQYIPKEYENMVKQIIKHMKQTGEWGQYFPANQSPFAYNETTAQDHFPLTKEKALQKGYTWKNHETREDTEQDNIMICSVTKKPYRLIPQEIKLYEKLNIPFPNKCPEQRLSERQTKVNPHKLWKRKCTKTGKEILSSYSPDRPEFIYSEEAYLEEVH